MLSTRHSLLLALVALIQTTVVVMATEEIEERLSELNGPEGESDGALNTLLDEMIWENNEKPNFGKWR